jgi:Zn ribbon nucleic-acid-binding protein
MAPHAANCAECQSTDTMFLPYVSSQSWVWYFRCSKCGHIWAIDKKPAVLVQSDKASAF